jgi:hypothetical protein
MVVLVATVYSGKYVAEFTEIGISARSSGMGGIAVSQNHGAQAVFFNPSGYGENHQFYVLHAMLYDNLFNVNAASLFYPVNKYSLAVGFARFSTDDIPFTREDGFYDWGTDGIPGTNDPDGTEGNGIKDPGEPVRSDALDLKSEGDNLFVIAVSRPLNNRIKAGLSFKYLTHNIGGYT